MACWPWKSGSFCCLVHPVIRTYLRLLTCVASRQRWQQSYTHTDKQHTHTHTHKKLLLHKSRHRDLKREGNKKKENKTSFCGEFHKGCYLKKEEAETDVMVLDSYTGARLMSAKRGGGDETVAHHRRPAKTTTPVGMTAF